MSVESFGDGRDRDHLCAGGAGAGEAIQRGRIKRQDGAHVGFRRDVNFGLAGRGADGHARRHRPVWVVCRVSDGFGMSSGERLERNNLPGVAVFPERCRVLADIGAHIKHAIDVMVGQQRDDVVPVLCTTRKGCEIVAESSGELACKSDHELATVRG